MRDELCEDEGCPQHGMDHVCIDPTRSEPAFTDEQIQAEAEAFGVRAGFTYGWRNMESQARRMCERAALEALTARSLLAERQSHPVRGGGVSDPDWRIAYFDRWREAAKEKGYAGIAEAINAAPSFIAGRDGE